MTQLILARKKFLSAACLLGALLGIIPARLLIAQTTIATLKSNFENPPADSRPMMRWWWFGPAVEKPEILHELEQMKADGIGERSWLSFIPRWSMTQQDVWSMSGF